MNWGKSLGFIARVGLGSVLAWVALAALPQAAAARATVPLEEAVRLEPGATCLEATRLIGHIETWLGAGTVDAGLTIDVEGSPTFARSVSFKIMRRHTALTERRFDPGPALCEDFHAAVGLAIALACKASLLDGPAGQEAGASGTPARPVHSEPDWAAGVDAIGGALVLPGATFGGGVWLQYALGSGFQLRAGALALLAPPRELDTAGRGFDAWLASGRLDLCFRLSAIGSTRLAACTGFMAGAIRTTGRGFTPASSELTPHVALSNGLSLAFEVSRRWSFAIAPTLIAPLTRTKFEIRNNSNRVVARDTLPTAGAFLSVGVAHAF